MITDEPVDPGDSANSVGPTAGSSDVGARGGVVDAALVIVTYNSADYLAGLLGSIPQAANGLTLRTIVVDNDSVDSTATVASTWPGVTFISTGGNLGYSGAINVARAHAGPARALVILNPDLVLNPNAIVLLLDALSDPSVGIAAPTNLEPDGRVFHHLHQEAGVLRAFGDSCFGAHWRRRPRFLSEMLLRDEDYRPRDVAWAGGAALAISARCNEAVGDWDSEHYFLYAEETDYARRARDLGFRVRYVPEASVTHHGAGSGQSPRLRALMSVNRIRYFEAQRAPHAAFAYRWAVTFQHVLRASDPDHRAALRYVRSRRMWSDLPPHSPASSATY